MANPQMNQLDSIRKESEVMKCPHCGKSIRGHAGGTRVFRQLSPAQQRAAIAKTARDLRDMRRIYVTSRQ